MLLLRRFSFGHAQRAGLLCVTTTWLIGRRRENHRPGFRFFLAMESRFGFVSAYPDVQLVLGNFGSWKPTNAVSWGIPCISRPSSMTPEAARFACDRSHAV